MEQSTGSVHQVQRVAFTLPKGTECIILYTPGLQSYRGMPKLPVLTRTVCPIILHQFCHASIPSTLGLVTGCPGCAKPDRAPMALEAQFGG